MDEHRLDDSRGEVGEHIHGDHPPDAFVSPSMIEADEAFRRDFRELSKEHPGEWVAYHGSERIGFAPTKDQMVHECLERGLRRGEFFVTCVEPLEELFWGPGPLGDLLGEVPEPFVSPQLNRAYEAFRRDLTQLLQEHPGQWVGCHGTERIGFAPTKDQMVHECLDRGLKRGEFFVTCVEPQEEFMIGLGLIGDFFHGPSLNPLDDPGTDLCPSAESDRNPGRKSD